MMMVLGFCCCCCWVFCDGLCSSRGGIKEQGPFHYTPKIESFLSIGALLKVSREDCITSSEFSAGGCKWVLKIHWEELKDDKDKGCNRLDRNCKVFGNYDYGGYRNHSASYWFNANANGWGYCHFIPLSDLKDCSKGYLENDDLVIEVNFESILRILRKLKKHTGCVKTVSFNPSGDILVSESDDKKFLFIQLSLRCWNSYCMVCINVLEWCCCRHPSSTRNLLEAIVQ